MYCKLTVQIAVHCAEHCTFPWRCNKPSLLNLLHHPALLQFPQHAYCVAQVEGMPEAAARVRYTPTFGIYRSGRLVDEVVGREPQRLADHLWLHAD
jgi:hypothetical protein